MQPRPFAQVMYEHSPDEWSYPVALGTLKFYVWGLINDVVTRRELRNVYIELEEHRSDYDSARAQGMSPTAALEHLALLARQTAVGSESPTGEGGPPPRP